MGKTDGARRKREAAAAVKGTPKRVSAAPAAARAVFLVASGDQRLSANRKCWPAQQRVEAAVGRAVAAAGWRVVRAHEPDADAGHGFICSQRQGIDVFRSIPDDAPVIVCEAVWQYSYHVLAGLRDHGGPILTCANFEGEWPGLVGMLNLNACLAKMGVPYSTLWSVDFTDAFFRDGLRAWLRAGVLEHDRSHIRPLLHPAAVLSKSAQALGAELAEQLLERKAIAGIFDEGCMGMYGAIFDDELLNAIGIYKERLSQSALLAEMRLVTDEEEEEEEEDEEEARDGRRGREDGRTLVVPRASTRAGSWVRGRAGASGRPFVRALGACTRPTIGRLSR